MLQDCCEDRFGRCSMLVMGMGGDSEGSEDKEIISAGENQVADVSERYDDVRAADTDLRSKESRLNDADLKPFLSEFTAVKRLLDFLHHNISVGCIWRFMNCSGSQNSAESKCEEGFTDCSNSLHDDGSKDWKGLPDGPSISFQTLDIKEGNCH